VAQDETGVTFRSGGATRFHAADRVEKVELGVGAPAPADPRAAAPGGPAAGSEEPRDRSPGKAADAPRVAPLLSEKAAAWVAELAARSNSTDEQVRRSVAAALRALGPAAVPTIRAQAASATDPAARTFLERVAAEIASRKAVPDDPPPLDATGTPPRPDRRPGGRGALVEKIAAELEAREDQRPGLVRVLGDLERDGHRILRSVREEGLTPADATTRFAELRDRIRTAAATVLDEGQAAAFEGMLDRWIEGQKERAAKAAAKPAPEK
jgi:hypothetical protein